MRQTKVKNIPAAPDAEAAFFTFIRTWGLFRNTMGPFFARFGISSSQWSVLRVLYRAEAEGLVNLRLTDLGQRLLVKPPCVTTIVDRLERAGMVDRTASETDQRAKQVRLTAAGREFVERVLQDHPAQIRSVMAGLSETQQKQLHQLMERMAAHLESLSGGGI
jgi:DNA-binding MarR family transcriptional regulator